MSINLLRQKALLSVPKVLDIIFNNADFDFNNKLDIVKFRVKSEKGIIEKCEKKNLEFENCYDLIGIRFILKSDSDCYELCHLLTKINMFEFIEVRDYIKNPQMPNNYQALHVLIKYNNLPCELQILSTRMYKESKGKHDNYKKVKGSN